MSVCKTVDRITAGYSGMSQSVAPGGRQSRGRFLIAVGTGRLRWRESGKEKERPIAADMHVRVSARATKEESRCEVRPTLSPSKRLTTFRPAPRTARSVAGFLGERLRKELGRGEGKVPGDDGSF